MKDEIVLTREGGDRVRVDVVANIYGGNLWYSVTVTTKAKGKRTWLDVFSSDAYDYRRLNQPDRAVYIRNKQLEHVTEEEIAAAKLVCWEAMKP